jgi:hypothetical protein
MCHDNLSFFIKTLQLLFGNKNCLLLKFGKENIHKSGLMKLPVGYIFTINLYVEPDIWQDIWYRYPAFRLPGYLAGRMSGQISIWCIPNNNTSFNTHLKLCDPGGKAARSPSTREEGAGEGKVALAGRGGQGEEVRYKMSPSMREEGAGEGRVVAGVREGRGGQVEEVWYRISPSPPQFKGDIDLVMQKITVVDGI